MASKLDQLRQLGGRNVAESTGASRADGLPPGLDLTQSAGMPARLVGLAKEKAPPGFPLRESSGIPSNRVRSSMRNRWPGWRSRYGPAASFSRFESGGTRAGGST